MYGNDAEVIFIFFNNTPTTEIYTLPLHDALPIYRRRRRLLPRVAQREQGAATPRLLQVDAPAPDDRSEEHTSELQSRQYLVCRLLLDKKNKRHPHLASQLAFLLIGCHSSAILPLS